MIKRETGVYKTSLGGIIQLEDLRQYKSKVKEPLKTTLKNGNYTVYGVPPPASGAIYQFILGILDGEQIDIIIFDNLNYV